MALGHFHHGLQRAQGARGAVHRVHDHQPLAMARHHAVQMLRVVMPEGMARCPSRMHALPQRRMGHGVHINRCLGVGDGLNQAGIGGITGLADETVLLAQPLCHGLFQRMGRVLSMQKSARLDDKLVVLAQGGKLRTHNGWMARDAQVVVAIQTHRVRASLAAVQQKTPAQGVQPRGEITRNALQQMGRKWRVDRA